MMAKTLALLLAVLATGCGGAMYKSYDSAYGAAPTPEEAEYAAPAAPAEASVSFDGDYVFESDEGSVPANRADPPSEPTRRPDDGAKRNDLETPLVVYTGYLKLRVKRLLEAVDEVTRITEEQGGYIESLTREAIVVRVPAGDFAEALASFIGLGELLERQIRALDVTEQFTDLGARLAVAREARARLLALLEKTDDVDERLLILEEIKRLSERIESIESTLATLRNLVDFFTITIELVPVLEDSAPDLHRSPFSWIGDLAAHRTTLHDGKGEFEMKLPKGFVLFEKDDDYRAQAADTTVIRGAVVDNEPLGTNAFWSAAVHHEMEGRAEKLVEDGDAGALSYRLYRSEDVQPRYYLIAVYARYEDLYVVEVFYPNEDAHLAHHKAVVEALASFEVR